jgi:hypothetical protein
MSSRPELANALRALAMDAVQQANSGHPGMPMGMAEIAEALWHRHLRHNPANPHWINRDRFVLSNGHGSMLLYALLHLTGYKLPMGELKNFRTLYGGDTKGAGGHADRIKPPSMMGYFNQLLAMAVILHDGYGSIDFCAHLLQRYDTAQGTRYRDLYLQALANR